VKRETEADASESPGNFAKQGRCEAVKSKMAWRYCKPAECLRRDPVELAKIDLCYGLEVALRTQPQTRGPRAVSVPGKTFRSARLDRLPDREIGRLRVPACLEVRARDQGEEVSAHSVSGAAQALEVGEPEAAA